jgi:RNA polymerase sigma factor (sigma-70 family)
MSHFDQTRQTLIERIRDQHDEPAWEDFVSIYEAYIYAIIRRMGVSPSDSKDVHQDILLQIWKKLPEYRKLPGTRFRGWLGTVTLNAARYFIRGRVNKSKTLEKLENNFAQLDDKDSDIDKIINEEWDFFLADKALENVKAAFTGRGIEVFQLSLKGESISQIAVTLKLEESSVYQLRARVKKSLTKEISRLREELD